MPYAAKTRISSKDTAQRRPAAEHAGRAPLTSANHQALLEQSPRLIAQRQEIQMLQGPAKLAQRQATARQASKRTGLPDGLKTGIESLSGMSMDHVNVHYNSAQPAQLNAHAYAQGSAIHVAPGQEQHLPHEAWHVVQQAQGRVKPTMQMKAGVAVNEDAGLEREADVMGARAAALPSHAFERSLAPDSMVEGTHSDSLKQLKSLEHHSECGCASCMSQLVQKKDVQVAQLTCDAGHKQHKKGPCPDSATGKVLNSNKNHNPNAGVSGGGGSAQSSVDRDAFVMANKDGRTSRKELNRAYKEANK
jgi:hypothetical protein